MMKRIFFGLIVLLLVLSAVTGVVYLRDSNSRIDALRSGGTVVETSVGPIEYQMVGANAANTVLFFHGTPGGYDQGLGEIEDAQVLTMSRPGYLGTPLSSGAAPADQATAAAALLNTLGINQVAVVGASGGGPAAYTFAATYPQRTIGLIAMEAISHSMPADELGLPNSDLVVWLMIKSLTATQDDAGVVSQIAQNASDREKLAEQPDVQKEVAGMIWSMWPPSLRKEGFDNDFAHFQDLNLPLEAIRVPTLIVHGTKDQSVPYAHAEHAVARVPGAQLHAIADAGHMMPFAHAEEVNSVVDEFFTRVRAQ